MSDSTQIRDLADRLEMEDWNIAAAELRAYADLLDLFVGLTEQFGVVVERIWAPGDTYLAVGDEQVFDVPCGAKVHRFRTKWREVAE